jgi:hypothetical protein
MEGMVDNRVQTQNTARRARRIARRAGTAQSETGGAAIRIQGSEK